MTRLLLLTSWLLLSACACAQQDLWRTIAREVCACAAAVAPTDLRTAGPDCVRTAAQPYAARLLADYELDVASPRARDEVAEGLLPYLTADCPYLATIVDAVVDRELRWADGAPSSVARYAAPKGPRPPDAQKVTGEPPARPFLIGTAGPGGQPGVILLTTTAGRYRVRLPRAVQRTLDYGPADRLRVHYRREWEKGSSNARVRLVATRVERLE